MNTFFFFFEGSIAGGVDEETFIRAFEDVPKIAIYSAKDMEEHLISMRSVIQDASNDWAKRAETVFVLFHFFVDQFFFLYSLVDAFSPLNELGKFRIDFYYLMSLRCFRTLNFLFSYCNNQHCLN